MPVGLIFCISAAIMGARSIAIRENDPMATGELPLVSRSLLSVGQCVTLAICLEATAPKPGNVHRGADFEELTFVQFLAAAVAAGPALQAAAGQGVGAATLAAVKATCDWAGSNTSLGTILLLAPLACVPAAEPLAAGVTKVLAQLTPADCHAVYKAINLANPGGMGRVEEADLSGPPPDDLLAAMQLAADRDLVARQYTNGFAEVFQVQRWLAEAATAGLPLQTAIIHSFLQQMAAEPDSLIGRKCGPEIAAQSAARAAAVLAAGEPGSARYLQALDDLDFWLRSDGHRRNPGTSADLVAAALFVQLREGQLQGPLDLPRWQGGI